MSSLRDNYLLAHRIHLTAKYAKPFPFPLDQWDRPGTIPLSAPKSFASTPKITTQLLRDLLFYAF